MMAYFKSRTPREQALLAAMAGVLFLFCLWQFAVKPVMTMRADAQRIQAAALRDYNIVRSGAPAMTQNTGAAAQAAAFDRSVIVSLAAKQGLPISRLQNETGGALKVWFEGVQSAQIYGFLSALTNGYAASVSGVQISRRSDGVISAQITLRGL